MTVEERKEIILGKIEEMKAEGADMQIALETLGVTVNEQVDQRS